MLMTKCIEWTEVSDGTEHYRKENHYCQAVLQSAGQVPCLVVSVCSSHLDNVPLMLSQHVLALQSSGAAQAEEQSPRGRMQNMKSK